MLFEKPQMTTMQVELDDLIVTSGPCSPDCQIQDCTNVCETNDCGNGNYGVECGNYFYIPVPG